MRDSEAEPVNSAVTLTVNGLRRTVLSDGQQTLLTALRKVLGLTGTKRGCNQGVCGACTVLVDGEPVRACLSLTANCGGREVQTIEGLATRDRLAPIQQALIDENAVQCGFCTSGMALTAHAFLQRHSQPTVDEIRAALSGNLCRCSGYRKIVDAVARAAAGGQTEASGDAE